MLLLTSKNQLCKACPCLFQAILTTDYGRPMKPFFIEIPNFCTQPDGTLFFLIFTYLRGRSHWNSRDYASIVAICHFLKPETNKGYFRLYFELVEKSCRGRHHSEILKTNTKTLIYSIWIRPQGSQGCQKVCQGPLNMPFEIWCANIAPERHKLWKIVKISKKFQKKPCFFRVLQIFFNFWAILAHQTSNGMFSGPWRIFWHPFTYCVLFISDKSLCKHLERK